MVKRLLKTLIYVFIFSFAFLLLSFNIKLKATVLTSPTIETLGARIRTNVTERQGLRFEAKIDTLDEVTEHGFYIAMGSHSKDDFQIALQINSPTINGSLLKNYKITGTGLNFYAVVYGFTPEYYPTNISAIAYFIKDGNINLSNSSVTRNILDIAIKVKLDGFNNEFVDEIIKNNIVEVGPNKPINTIKEGLAIIKPGQTLLLDEGEYNENIIIETSNIRIISKKIIASPVLSKTLKNSTLTSIITIWDNVKDITIDGLEFVGKSQIKTTKTGGQDNLIIKNNIFKDCTNTENALNVGCIVLNGPMKGFKFINNQCLNIRYKRFIISYTSTQIIHEDFQINNNTFKTYKDMYGEYLVNEYIKLYGLLNGKVEFINNTFDGSIDGCIDVTNHDNINLIFKDNKFINIKNKVIYITGKPSSQNKNNIYIIHNLFDNENLNKTKHNAIQIGLQNYDETNLNMSINYNIFKGWDNVIIGKMDGKTIPIINFDNNFLLPFNNQLIDNTYFDNIAKSYSIFNSEEELETSYKNYK